MSEFRTMLYNDAAKVRKKLTNEDLIELAKLGDTQQLAIQMLGWMHGPVMRQVRKKVMVPASIDSDDLYSEATYVMMDLVNAWDYKQGMSLQNWVMTFGFLRMRNWIIHEQKQWMPSIDNLVGDYNLDKSSTWDADQWRGVVSTDNNDSPVEAEVDLEMINKQVEYSKAKMTEKQQQAFDMYYLQGLNYPQIGMALDISPQMARKHVQAGLQKIRSSLS